MFALMNLLVLFALIVATSGLCKGQPWSFTYLFMAFLFLAHGCYAVNSLDMPMLLAKVQLNAGVTSAEAVEQLKAQVDFWKLSIPVISLGIGCSMVNSFFSSSKPSI
jgi:hypothetical protein